MSLHIDIGWLYATLLMSVRVAAATGIAPVFGPAKIPGAVKVLIAFVLSAFIVSANALQLTNINSVGDLIVAALCEAIIGLAFGFGFLVAYAATQIAGRALDVQIGFGAASILNPATQTLAPLIGSIFGTVMVVVFLALDGHHLLLQALATSATIMPIGHVEALDVTTVVLQSGVMFTFGLALAAPVMFVLWLSDVAMAIFARSMPQLNVFVLSFAVKIILGITSLALSLSITRFLFGGLFDSTAHYWDGLVTAH